MLFAVTFGSETCLKVGSNLTANLSASNHIGSFLCKDEPGNGRNDEEDPDVKVIDVTSEVRKRSTCILLLMLFTIDFIL